MGRWPIRAAVLMTAMPVGPWSGLRWWCRSATFTTARRAPSSPAVVAKSAANSRSLARKDGFGLSRSCPAYRRRPRSSPLSSAPVRASALCSSESRLQMTASAPEAAASSTSVMGRTRPPTMLRTLARNDLVAWRGARRVPSGLIKSCPSVWKRGVISSRYASIREAGAPASPSAHRSRPTLSSATTSPVLIRSFPTICCAWRQALQTSANGRRPWAHSASALERGSNSSPLSTEPASRMIVLGLRRCEASVAAAIFLATTARTVAGRASQSRQSAWPRGGPCSSCDAACGASCASNSSSESLASDGTLPSLSDSESDPPRSSGGPELEREPEPPSELSDSRSAASRSAARAPSASRRPATFSSFLPSASRSLRAVFRASSSASRPGPRRTANRPSICRRAASRFSRTVSRSTFVGGSSTAAWASALPAGGPAGGLSSSRSIAVGASNARYAADAVS